MISEANYTNNFQNGWVRKFYHCGTFLEAKRLKNNLRSKGIWAYQTTLKSDPALGDHTSVAVKNH